MENKVRVRDMRSLHLEKQRLKVLCKENEAKLMIHFDELKNNYSRMALSSVLPFRGTARETVFQLLDFVNDIILPNIFGLSFKSGGGGWKQNLLKVIQALMIAWSFRFFRRIFARKKKEAK